MPMASSRYDSDEPHPLHVHATFLACPPQSLSLQQLYARALTRSLRGRRWRAGVAGGARRGPE